MHGLVAGFWLADNGSIMDVPCVVRPLLRSYRKSREIPVNASGWGVLTGPSWTEGVGPHVLYTRNLPHELEPAPLPGGEENMATTMLRAPTEQLRYGH